jgi:hypothetical protein
MIMSIFIFIILMMTLLSLLLIIASEKFFESPTFLIFINNEERFLFLYII